MINNCSDPTFAFNDGSKLHVIPAFDKRLQPLSNLHQYYLLGLGVGGRILAVLGIWQYSITLRLDPDSTHMRAGKNNGCVKDAAGTKPRAPSPFRAARTPRNKESTRSISMETWNSDSADGDPYTHESLSTFDARSSSGSDTSDSTILMGSRPNLLQDLKMLPDCDNSERTWVWVNYGTASILANHSEDITSWLLLKYRPHRNRTKHDEELARVINSFNKVFLSQPTTTGARGHTRGYGGRCKGDTGTGSGTGNRAKGSQRDGMTSGDGERRPKRHKPSNDGGPNQGGGPPQGNASSGSNVPSSGLPGGDCTWCNESFATTDDLLQHRINRHCCPICEEKFRIDENGRWVLPSHITSVDKFVFRDPADMKQHITRIHLRPFECLVETCKERFGGSSFKRHLREQHRDRYSEQDVEREFCSLGSSNLGYPELTTLVNQFRNTCPTKEKLKEMLYRNGVKLYDCENQRTIVDNLRTHSDIPFEPPTRPRKPRGPRVPGRGAGGRPRPASVSPPDPVPPVPTMSSGGTTSVPNPTMPWTGVCQTGFDPGTGIHSVLQPNQQVQQIYQNLHFSSLPQQRVDVCPPAPTPTVRQYTSAPPQMRQHNTRLLSQNLDLVPPDAVGSGTTTSAFEPAHAPPPPPPPPAVPTVSTSPPGWPLMAPIPITLPTEPPVPAHSAMPCNFELGDHHLWGDFDFVNFSRSTSVATDRAPSSDLPAREQPAPSSDPVSLGTHQAPVGDEGEGEYEDVEETNLALLDRWILVDLDEFRALFAVISTGVAKSGNGALVAGMLYTWDSQNLILAILAHGTTAHMLFTAWPPKAVSEFGISEKEFQTLDCTIAIKLRAFKKIWESMSARAIGRHGSILAGLLCADENCPLILAIRKYAQQATESLPLCPPQEPSTPADSGVCDGKTTVVGTHVTNC